MRIETVQRPLRELVRSFTTGKILLPQFQRDYVWKPKKIRNLLDSLLMEYPIGGFYLWRPSSGAFDPKPKKFGEGTQVINAEFSGYLIDGQQRLTSLEAAYSLYSGEDRDGLELRCYLDLAATNADRVRDTKLFVSYGGHRAIARRIDDGDPTLMSVSTFFEQLDKNAEREQDQRAEATLRGLGWGTRRVEEALEHLDRARKMLDQEVPCTTVYDVSDQQAVEVFSRLNKGGTPLKQGDVTAAGLARGSALLVLKAMREFVSGARPQRLGFSFSFAFRALVVFHRGSAQFSSLKPDWMDAGGPDGRSLYQSWKTAQKALDSTLSFADIKMGWSRRLLLPSTNALIVLAAALDKTDLRISPEEEQRIKQWLCLTALRGTFQGSVETTINRFLRAVKESRRKPAMALVEALQRDEARRVRPDELTHGSPLWGSAVHVIHAWLVSQDARDWLDQERTIDALARAEGTKFPGGDLTVHHIFSRKILSDAGILDLANRPANFALLSRSTNAEFGEKAPDDVLRTLTPQQRKQAKKQFFGEEAGDRLGRDRYNEFCDWRAARLAEALNEFLGIE
ncbi:MAG TPA: DUF262 domain-containing protein [Vicinamibacterales bacterium]|nr:DUF262 domain-containing protein [Vicinamibacterales bacterium]